MIGSTTSDEAGGNFRLVSFNVRRCHGLFRLYSPRRVLRALAPLGPDAVALQEVDSGRSCDGAPQLDFLARGLAMQPVEGYCRPHRSGGRYGNALLTRRPPLSIRCHDLTRPGREPRGALEVRLSGLTIIVTHLGLCRAERRDQARMLAEIVAAVDGPLVLAGDFNEWRPHPAPDDLDRLLGPAAAPPTWPALCPIIALDRVRARPAQMIAALFTHRSAAARLASDHLPLVADLAFR